MTSGGRAPPVRTGGGGLGAPSETGRGGCCSASLRGVTPAVRRPRRLREGAVSPRPRPAMWGNPAGARASAGVGAGRDRCLASRRTPAPGGRGCLGKHQLAPRLGFAGGSVCPHFNLTPLSVATREKAAISAWLVQFIFRAPCLYQPCKLYQVFSPFSGGCHTSL